LFNQLECFQSGRHKAEVAEIFVELAEHPVLAVDMCEFEEIVE
jgi:hypothetical protein